MSPITVTRRLATLLLLALVAGCADSRPRVPHEVHWTPERWAALDKATEEYVANLPADAPIVIDTDAWGCSSRRVSVPFEGKRYPVMIAPPACECCGREY